MILTCPNCGTQYAVKDGAVPPQGRQVRCAACKHSWHQAPEGSAAVDEPETATPEPVPPPFGEEQVESPPSDEAESIVEATMIEPRSGPEAEERAFEEAALEAEASPNRLADAPPATAIEQSWQAEPEPTEPNVVESDWQEPPEAEAQTDEFSPFAVRGDEETPKRRSRILPVLLTIVLIAGIAAAFWFFAPPEWKSKVGLGGTGQSPLALVTTHMDRQRLESGNELLTVTGRVINPTTEAQSVPPLQAQLRSSKGALVYSWTIAPPTRTLAPGASASFNSAEVNVPPGGEELTITVGPPKA